MPRPTAGERARTTLARTEVSTVTTYPRDPMARPHQTVAVCAVQPDGRLLLTLEAKSWAVRNLLARPLAGVRVVDPDDGSWVLVRGGVRRLPGAPRPGSVAFLLDATSVRLGGPTVGEELVDADTYRRSEPDPLRDEAPGLLRHLQHAHRPDLLGCLRRHGLTEAEWVEPHALDRYGLELTVVTADAVGRVRLPFARPLRSLDDLGPGLHTALRCRCRPPADV
jgi:hypothetical protein